jgi:hypothetical protein
LDLTPTEPIPPRIYFLSKIHKLKTPKDELKGRPVVSTINSPLYNITKYCSNILSRAFNSKYAIKNSFEFIEKLKNITVPRGYVMISLDVQSLFTSIPTHIFLDCINKNWHQIEKHTNIPKTLFLNMIIFIRKVVIEER